MITFQFETRIVSSWRTTDKQFHRLNKPAFSKLVGKWTEEL